MTVLNQSIDTVNIRFEKNGKFNILTSQPNYRNPLIHCHTSESIPKQDQLRNSSTESTSSSIPNKTRKKSGYNRKPEYRSRTGCNMEIY